MLTKWIDGRAARTSEHISIHGANFLNLIWQSINGNIWLNIDEHEALFDGITRSLAITIKGDIDAIIQLSFFEFEVDHSATQGNRDFFHKARTRCNAGARRWDLRNLILIIHESIYHALLHVCATIKGNLSY